jgi:hypothetical protein
MQGFIGRGPVFAFRNSDCEQQMLEWAECEWAYDRQSHIGKPNRAQSRAR